MSSDSKFTTDDNGNVAVRVAASSNETNSPSMFTTDDNGNVAIRIVGGGDLQKETMPTASSSYYKKIYQYVGDTTSTYTCGYFYRCTQTSAPVVEHTTIQQTDEIGWSLGTLTVDNDKFKAKVGGVELAYIFNALGYPTGVTVEIGSSQVELERDSASDVPSLNKYFWKSSDNVSYYTNTTDAEVGTVLTNVQETVVATVLAVTERAEIGTGIWFNGGHKVELYDYGITTSATAMVGNEITAEYFAAKEAVYGWTQINVQP